MAIISNVIEENGPLTLIETTISTEVERYGRVIGETKDTVYDVHCEKCDEFPAQAVSRAEADDEFKTHEHKVAE
jgi:hypothetical protein